MSSRNIRRVATKTLLIYIATATQSKFVVRRSKNFKCFSISCFVCADMLGQSGGRRRVSSGGKRGKKLEKGGESGGPESCMEIEKGESGSKSRRVRAHQCS